MNRLTPYRPNYIDIGPLPPPEEFNSLEEMFNTKWLTEYMQFDKENESIQIRNIQIESGNPGETFYWVKLRDERKDMYYTIGKLDSLEHIPEDMLINEEEFAMYLERAKVRIATYREQRLQQRIPHLIKN